MEIQLPRPISRIVFRCSEPTRTHLLSALPIHEGMMLSEELLAQAREQAKAHMERLAVHVREALPPPTDGSVYVVVWDPAIPPERVRMAPGDQEAMLVEKTAPRHPGSSGVVTLAILVGKDGSVADVKPFPGPESLTAPAIEAVRNWKYRPMLLNGRPVEVETTVEVRFPPGEQRPGVI